MRKEVLNATRTIVRITNFQLVLLTNIIAVITGKFENYMLTVDDTLKEINRKLIRCWHIIQFIFFLKVLVKRCLQITVVTRPTSLDKPRLITMFQFSLKLLKNTHVGAVGIS